MFEEVARIDADYPDAIVFRTIVLADEGRYDEAVASLETLDLDSAPPEVIQIVNQRGVAGEVYGESRRAAIEDATAPTLGELDLTVEQALAAAGYLFSDAADASSPVNALKLYRAIREDDPTHPAASSREAWLLFQSGLSGAEELIDATVAAHPEEAEALFTRASIRFGTDQIEAGCADLAALLGSPATEPAFEAAAAELDASFC